MRAGAASPSGVRVNAATHMTRGPRERDSQLRRAWQAI